MKAGIRTIGAIACGIAGLSASAAAPAQGGPATRIVKTFADCRAIADSAARLACYDAAADNLATAVAKKDITLIDREDVRKTRRSLFGFALPRLPFFEGDGSKEDAPVREVEVTIASVRNLGNGKYRFTLPDGAVWENTEASPYGTPKPNGKVKIKQATLGNYFLSFDGSRTVRGKRVQ